MSTNYDMICDIHIGDLGLTEEPVDARRTTTITPPLPAHAPASAGMEFGDIEGEPLMFVTAFGGPCNESPDDFDYMKFMGAA